jgi:hypothetical protein
MPKPAGFEALCAQLCCNPPPEPYEELQARWRGLKADKAGGAPRKDPDLCAAYKRVSRVQNAAEKTVRWIAGETDESDAKLRQYLAPPCETCSGPDEPNEREKAMLQKLGGFYDKPPPSRSHSRNPVVVFSTLVAVCCFFLPCDPRPGWALRLDPHAKADRVMRRNLVQVACSSYSREVLRTEGNWAISNRVFAQASEQVKKCSKQEAEERIVLFLLKDEDVGGVDTLLEESWAARLKHEWREHCRPEGGVRGRKGGLAIQGLLSEVALKIKATVDKAKGAQQNFHQTPCFRESCPLVRGGRKLWTPATTNPNGALLFALFLLRRRGPKRRLPASRP